MIFLFRSWSGSQKRTALWTHPTNRQARVYQPLPQEDGHCTQEKSIGEQARRERSWKANKRQMHTPPELLSWCHLKQPWEPGGYEPRHLGLLIPLLLQLMRTPTIPAVQMAEGPGAFLKQPLLRANLHHLMLIIAEQTFLVMCFKPLSPSTNACPALCF